MPSISDAIAKNQARIAAGGETGTGVGPIQSPIMPAPTPPQDLPIGLGLPQRGTIPIDLVNPADINDSNRIFRGAGARSSVYPYPTAAPVVTKTIVSQVAAAPSAPSSQSSAISLQTNGAPNPVQSTENLIAGTGITLTADQAGGTTIDAAPTGGFDWFFWPEFTPNGASAGGVIAPTANQILFFPFQLPVAITVNNIAMLQAAFSPADTNSWGIYDHNGNLLCDVGPQVVNISSDTWLSAPVSQGPTTLPAGNYFIAVTTQAGRANFIGMIIYYRAYPSSPTASVSSGGQLPASIIIGSFAPSTPQASATYVPIFYLN